MRLIFFILLFIGWGFSCSAQRFSASEIEQANTAKDEKYLSTEEKAIILYMNLARMDGKKFFEQYLIPYINRYNETMKKYKNFEQIKVKTNNPYYVSLKNTLYKTKDLPLFYPDEDLTKISKGHAIDLYKSKTESHQSSNGQSLATRINSAFLNTNFSENIDFGSNKGLNIVGHLLFDFGVPDLGHRKNILDEKYKFHFIGVSIQKHQLYDYCAVINFMSETVDNLATK